MSFSYLPSDLIQLAVAASTKVCSVSFLEAVSPCHFWKSSFFIPMRFRISMLHTSMFSVLTFPRWLNFCSCFILSCPSFANDYTLSTYNGCLFHSSRVPLLLCLEVHAVFFLHLLSIRCSLYMLLKFYPSIMNPSMITSLCSLNKSDENTYPVILSFVFF